MPFVRLPMPISMSGAPCQRPSTQRAAFACRPSLRRLEPNCCRVLERAVDNTLLAHRKLQKHGWFGAGRFAIRCHGKHAQRHPVFRCRLGFRNVCRDGLGLLRVLLFRANWLVAVIHRAILVVNVFAVVVVNRLAPAVIDPAGHPRPGSPCPVTEIWVVRPVDVIVIPPIVAEPIIEVAGMVLPPVSDVAAMYPGANPAIVRSGMRLGDVALSFRHPDEMVATRLARPTDVAGSLAWSSWSANVTGPITGSAWLANVTGSSTRSAGRPVSLAVPVAWAADLRSAALPRPLSRTRLNSAAGPRGNVDAISPTPGRAPILGSPLPGRFCKNSAAAPPAVHRPPNRPPE